MTTSILRADISWLSLSCLCNPHHLWSLLWLWLQWAWRIPLLIVYIAQNSIPIYSLARIKEAGYAMYLTDLSVCAIFLNLPSSIRFTKRWLLPNFKPPAVLRKLVVHSSIWSPEYSAIINTPRFEVFITCTSVLTCDIASCTLGMKVVHDRPMRILIRRLRCSLIIMTSTHAQQVRCQNQ